MTVEEHEELRELTNTIIDLVNEQQDSCGMITSDKMKIDVEKLIIGYVESKTTNGEKQNERMREWFSSRTGLPVAEPLYEHMNKLDEEMLKHLDEFSDRIIPPSEDLKRK